ncbi:MAG TPA: TAT-variant-translocated molybdopterin oxidoreductase, partial [Phycisphaerae bacterium]
MNEIADKPEFHEFVEREFPAHASEWLETNNKDAGTEGGSNRRTFLKVMGASMALAGLASCRRWPEEKLTPYAHRPANRMDGVPVHYATAFERGGMGQGVIAISFDGRPVKVDGNPGHPLNRGSSDMFLQGSILNVYDPDRSRGPVLREKGKREEKTWAAFEAEAAKLDKTSLVVLAEASRSPSVVRLRGDLVKAGAKWFEYEALSADNQRQGAKQYFGRPLRAVPRLDRAQMIVSIDADLFHGEPLSIMFNRDFASGRRLRDSAKAADADMNRLYVLESGYTITGTMADHRRSVKPSQIPQILRILAGRLGVGGTAPDNAGLGKEIQEFVDAIVAEVKTRKPLFVAGSRQPGEVHAVVAAINAAISGTVEYFDDTGDPRADADWTTHYEQLKAFASAAKTAKHVLVIGANPVLTAPADLKIGELLTEKGIHLGTHEDETAQSSAWHLPMAHYLEAWADVRTFDGTVSIAQPLIEPIFGGKSTAEFLAVLLGQKPEGFDIVRETAKSDYMKVSFSDWTWKTSMFNGMVAGTTANPAAAAPNPANAAAAVDALSKLPSGKGNELALFVGQVYDGRYANNGWLVELPDAMTRVSWENPLIISPKTAAELKVESDDVVLLKTAGNKTG